MYRVNISTHSGKAKWPAPLVDRGANGGIVGNDSKVLARTGKYVDLCGVDDHKVDDLELVTAGAVVETQNGPIIIIMNQYARMMNGKTIHSSGQMEHHKIVVKDQAHAITNVMPYLELHKGYRTPLCFINGLPYMKMRIPANKELETLPRVTITSDVPWDPRVLDLEPPDEWFSDQPKCLELIEESTFDEHGGYKESLPSAPEEGTEKILDAEDTTDDPNHDKENDSPLGVSRAAIKAYLHNLVHGEIVPEYWVFRVGRHLHQIDIDFRNACTNAHKVLPQAHTAPPALPMTPGPRRSPRDHPPPAPHKPTKRRLCRVTPEPTVVSDTPIKTMDGNPLGQSGDIILDDPDTPRTDYNNPSKVNDHKVESRMWVSAPFTKQKKEDISAPEKFFYGIPKDTIERTFKATTRLDRIITGETLWLRNALKAPNPALNVKRRNEPVAMDTIYGPVGHPSIANGSTHAQFFIGCKSNYRSVYPCGKSDKDVHRCVEDEIRKLGAVDVLVSDRARSQSSKKLHDVLRTFGIDDWQSEPHNKNQNFAKRGWQDTKRLSNWSTVSLWSPPIHLASWRYPTCACHSTTLRGRA